MNLSNLDISLESAAFDTALPCRWVVWSGGGEGAVGQCAVTAAHRLAVDTARRRPLVDCGG